MTNANPFFKSTRLALALGLALATAASPAFARGGSGGEGGGEGSHVMKPLCLQPTKAGAASKAKQKTGDQPQTAIYCR